MNAYNFDTESKYDENVMLVDIDYITPISSIEVYIMRTGSIIQSSDITECRVDELMGFDNYDKAVVSETFLNVRGARVPRLLRPKILGS